MKKSIAVLGMGRFGQFLAAELCKNGADVMIVDADEETIRRTAEKIGLNWETRSGMGYRALFKKWKNWEEIIQNHDILIYPRLGYDVTISQEFKHRVKLTHAPIIEISSTQIREALAKGESMRFYLPDNVYNYILQHKLYHNE